MKLKLNPNRRFQRKMRTAGEDMCSCGLLHCDSMHEAINSPYIRKLRKRQKEKVCIGCGKKECQCKRKLENGLIYNEELRTKEKLKQLEQWKQWKENQKKI